LQGGRATISGEPPLIQEPAKGLLVHIRESEVPEDLTHGPKEVALQPVIVTELMRIRLDGPMLRISTQFAVRCALHIAERESAYSHVCSNPGIN
jgi:hypothetical protein